MPTIAIEYRSLLLAGIVVLPFALPSGAFAQVTTGEPSNTAPAATSTEQTTAPPVTTATADQSDTTGLRDIIVTGTKLGAQNLQRTPIAVSVVDSRLLQDQGLSTVQDIANYVPNLTFSRNTGQAIIFIRGIGSTNAGAGSDPSVTEQVDGVYIARATAQVGDFLDVDRIEVLRGPQGTLYGRNAVGGTINIISRQPTDVFTGRFRLGYGNYNEKTAEGYVAGPLAKGLAASLAATYRDHDAFFRNIVPGVPSVGSAKRFGARTQIRYEPSADVDVTLRGDYQNIRDYFESYDHLLLSPPFPAPLANSLVGSYRDVAVNIPQTNKVDTGGVSLDINYRLGNGFALKSITAGRVLYSRIRNDSDQTEVDVQDLRVTEKQKQFSQEFNLNYTSAHFQAVGGLFFFADRDEQINNNVQPPSIATPSPASGIVQAAPVVHTTSYAAFAQGSYEVARGLRLIAGLRYTTENKSIDQNFTRTSLFPPALGTSSPGFPIVFSTRRKDNALTPKFGVDYQVAPTVFLYASATRGFKSGGFNNAARSAATAGFNPEKIWAYEAGAKTQFFDRKLRINLTGFTYDYKDLQVRQLLGPGNAIVANAASAKVRGIELETLVKPVPAVQFSANLSYLDARYRTFTTASVATAYATLIPNQRASDIPGVSIFDASGNRLESTPRWSGVFGVDLTPHLSGPYRFSAHADYAFRGRAYFDASNIAISSQKPYGVLDANIGFGPETGWKIEAFVKNATDKKFYQTISGSGNEPGAIVGDPRTYGVRVGYTF